MGRFRRCHDAELRQPLVQLLEPLLQLADDRLFLMFQLCLFSADRHQTVNELFVRGLWLRGLRRGCAALVLRGIARRADRGQQNDAPHHDGGASPEFP
jgi:hypothetical protein